MDISQLLLEEGLISNSDLEKAISFQEQNPIPLDRILIQMGLVDEEDLLFLISKKQKIPYINLSDYEIEKAVSGMIPLEITKKHQVFAFHKTNDYLAVAAAMLLEGNILDEIQKAAGMNLKIFLATSSEIQQAIKSLEDAS